MKIIGMLFIIASAIVFSFERAVAEERRLKVLEEIYRFILRLGVDIGCYLKPISDIADDFSSELLSSLGFFEEIKRSGVYSAYLTLDSQIRFSDEAKRVLDGFFSMLGNGYADDQIKLIESTRTELDGLIKKERERVPKEKKLSVTLSCGAALALIILLI